MSSVKTILHTHLLADLLELDAKIDGKKKHLTKMNKKYSKTSPEILRQHGAIIEESYDVVIKNLDEIEKTLEDYELFIKQIIRTVHKCKKIINKSNRIYNKAKIGTLEGLTKQLLRDNMPDTSTLTYLQSAVLEQPYDETSRLRHSYPSPNRP
jgi:hypothetical protein